MKYNQRDYPELSACGLNCGLCPRYYTEGTSRCPGCGGAGFYEKRPSCGVLSCTARRGGIAFCFACEEYPCARYDKAADIDSFITHKNMLENFARIQAEGLEAYQAELQEKMDILRLLLEEYNDGRRKSLYCIAVNLLPLADLRDALAEAAPDMDKKAKAKSMVRALEAIAEKRGISLKLRRAKI